MKEQLLLNNIEFLDKSFPGMQKMIEERKDKLLKKENILVQEEESLNGEKILTISSQERKLYLAGRRNPSKAPRNQISLWGKIQRSAPIFVVGMGNIHYLKQAIEETNQSSVIFVYEPSFSVFYKQLSRIDFKNVFSDRIVVLLVQGLNDDGMDEIISSMLVGDRVPLAKYVICPNYAEFCAKEVEKFAKLMEKHMLSYAINANTQVSFSKVLPENEVKNLLFIPKEYKAGQLDGKLPLDVPAIIVSAGPSLNKNIHVLKKAKNKAFIIAVDTAMKPLIKAGIIPDMFAIVDGKKPMTLFDMEEIREVPLLTTIDASNQILQYHKGKKFFFDEGDYLVQKMYEMAKVPLQALEIGGSVATLAFSLAFNLGYKRIVLVGQDLALTGNKTHVDGSFKDKMDIVDTQNCIMVKGNYEKLVPTREDMDHYRKWFEQAISLWEEYDVEFINATEGGAYIEGTTLDTLENVVEKYCVKEVDIEKIIDDLEPVFSLEQQKMLNRYLVNLTNEFVKIKKLAHEGYDQYQRLEKMCGGKNLNLAVYKKTLTRIKKITKKIENNDVNQLLTVTMTLANKIVQTGQYSDYKSFEEEGIAIAQKGKLYLSLVEECAEIFAKLTKDTFGDLEET